MGSTCNVIKIKERKRAEPDGSARLSSALLPLVILSPSLLSFHPFFLALDIIPPPPSSCLPPPLVVSSPLPSLSCFQIPPSCHHAISSFLLILVVVSSPVLSLGSPLVHRGWLVVLLRCRVCYMASCWPPLSHQGFAMPASCCPCRIALCWCLRYKEPLLLDRGRVIGPNLSSVLVLVGVGHRAVGVIDGWWCRQTSSIGGGVAVEIVGGWLGSTLHPWALASAVGL